MAALDGVESVLDNIAGLVLFVLRAGPTLVFWGTLAGLTWLVTRRTSLQLAAGLLLGTAGAIGVSRVTPAVVSASRAGEPAFLASVVAFVIVVAALACLVPARRAVRVDPVVALRND